MPEKPEICLNTLGTLLASYRRLVFFIECGLTLVQKIPILVLCPDRASLRQTIREHRISWAFPESDDSNNEMSDYTSSNLIITELYKMLPD